MDDATSKLLWAAPDIGPGHPPGGRRPADRRPADRRPADGRRIAVDPEHVERGLAQLVLTLIELLRQLMERQALRRVEGGSLTPDQEERLGVALMHLAEKMAELKEHFDLTDDDLNIHLGPLGDLL